MKLSVDSSSFAKRYVLENGSDKLDDLLQHTSHLALSVIVVPEIISGLNRRLREGSIVDNNYRQAKKQLLAEITRLKKRMKTLEQQYLTPRAWNQATIFRQFAQSSSQGIGMAGLDGFIFFANHRLGNMLGYENPDDAIGTNISEYYTKKDYDINVEADFSW